YYFRHEKGQHTMVLANTKWHHPALPGGALPYDNMEGGGRGEDRIHDWSKAQELRAGKYTLWDYTFEKPESRLEATQKILASVKVGQETHQLNGVNGALEIFDFPGEYAQRFDGIDKGGGDRAGEVERMFQDNRRTAEIRMQEEALPSLTIQGAGN